MYKKEKYILKKWQSKEQHTLNKNSIYLLDSFGGKNFKKENV